MSSPEFYSNARAYDIAFSYRDYPAECDFFIWCLETYGDLSLNVSAGHHTFLELGCGPARHAREFSRRGWRAYGLDLSTDMLEYASASAEAEGTPIETVQADMCDYTLAAPVALTANLLDSLTHLLTNQQVITHLRTVARNLLPGGLYIIELSHPSTIWRDSLPNQWSVDEGTTHIDMTFGLEDDPYDTITQQWIVTARMVVQEEGQPVRVIEERNNHRWYLAQELAALIDCANAFSQCWWFGDYSIPPMPLTSSQDCASMTVVLRK